MAAKEEEEKADRGEELAMGLWLSVKEGMLLDRDREK